MIETHIIKVGHSIIQTFQDTFISLNDSGIIECFNPSAITTFEFTPEKCLNNHFNCPRTRSCLWSWNDWWFHKQWSFGCVVAEMALGTSLFTGNGFWEYLLNICGRRLKRMLEMLESIREIRRSIFDYKVSRMEDNGVNLTHSRIRFFFFSRMMMNLLQFSDLYW
jgi:hypothetical protein